MKILAKAISIAANVFENKVDKGGQPYILHCLYVMEAGLDEDEKVAGVLHDVVEDTDITFEYLRKEGMSERSLDILKLLTHDKKEPYKDYVKRIATDISATRLKKRDLEHNTMVSRLKNLSKHNMDKLEEYFWAYTYLKTI